MEIQHIQYNKKNGWSAKELPKLDSENTLVLVFAAPEYINHIEPIEFLKTNYPNSKIMGCSTSGEIFNNSIHDHSLSVTIVKFNRTKIKISLARRAASSNSYEAGSTIANELNADDLTGIFILSEGLTINGSELVKGLNTLGKNHVTITGGLAGDGADFKKTWLIHDGKIYNDANAIAVGFYGNAIKIKHGSKGGWDIFGPERRITRAKNNELFELDGRSALSLYKQYLGEKSKDLPASGLLYPLSIRKNINDDKVVVRTILGINEENDSLIFAGDMPVGYLAQLMRANFDRLVNGSEEAGKLIFSNNDSDDSTLVIAVSCVGRRLLLGQRTEDEVNVLAEQLRPNTTLIGFYSYGELSPYDTGECALHNQTMTLTSFSESK